MKKRLLSIFFFNLLIFVVQAQKQVYIPLYLRDTTNVNGAQFSYTKTAQSTNFIVIWGNTVGTNPATYSDPNLAFNPQTVLDTLEAVYTFFKGTGFLDDSAGTNMAKYKCVVVIYNTWGPNGSMGWANGGTVDGVIGAFWVHPNAIRDGNVMAHEFTHSLQGMISVDRQNKVNTTGTIFGSDGYFYETHANFMRNNYDPAAVTDDIDSWHMLLPQPDWKIAYECYPWLFHAQIVHGIDIVNRLWRESYPQEYPLATYKRILGYNQSAFNDEMFGYCRRMACFDFPLHNWGSFFRAARTSALRNDILKAERTYDILQPIDTAMGRYIIPNGIAPQDYGYNVIPLYPESSGAVSVRFFGHTEVNNHAGWRYGFVTEKSDGTVSRYGSITSAVDATISYTLQSGESRLYLVVMGAPTDSLHLDANHNSQLGFPKHFRYPYELVITNAKPEGYQPVNNFRTQLKTGAGQKHSNGGGYVENSTVSSSVYVGPHAIVKNSTISDNARIEGTAIVMYATISDSVVVSENAAVYGGVYSGNARLSGNSLARKDTIWANARLDEIAVVENYKLHGTAHVAGDVWVYNDTGNCDNGAYYVMVNYYMNNLLPCDGRDSLYPANKDVNNPVRILKCLPGLNDADCVSLTALSQTGSIDLNWNIIGIAVKDFQVMRDTDSIATGRIRIASLAASDTSYSDASAQPNTDYWYWLKITDTSGLTYNSLAVKGRISVITGSLAAWNQQSIRAYPNPFSEAITLEASGNYTILDISGQIVEQGTCEGQKTLGRNLPPGTYLLKVENEQGGGIFKMSKL